MRGLIVGSLNVLSLWLCWAVVVGELPVAEITDKRLTVARDVAPFSSTVHLWQNSTLLLRMNIGIGLLWLAGMVFGPLIEKMMRLTDITKDPSCGNWYRGLRNFNLIPMLLLSIVLLMAHPHLSIRLAIGFDLLAISELLAFIAWVFVREAAQPQPKMERLEQTHGVVMKVASAAVLIGTPVAIGSPFVSIQSYVSTLQSPTTIWNGVVLLLRSRDHFVLGTAVAVLSIGFPLIKAAYLFLVAWKIISGRKRLHAVLSKVGRWSSAEALIICVLMIAYSVLCGAAVVTPHYGFWFYIAALVVNIAGYECAESSAGH